MNTLPKGPKVLFLVMAVCTTAVALVLAAPSKPLELATLGDSAVNSAPAIKISLAGRHTPEPAAEPEPSPAPQPVTKPKPEPEPEPIVAPKPEPVPTPVEQTQPETAEAPTAEASVSAGEEGQAQEEQAAVPLQTAGSASEIQSYLNKLSRHLARYYDYPRRARRLGQQGTSVVVFEFRRDGSLIEHSLRDSSGHTLLDESALEMLSQAAPLPEVPPGMHGNSFTYALPVSFKLR
ncbi:TonB family protein [Marinobacter sp. SBS5]|uniref:energy transducer TonB n=1 Tax=Marinobacter sp. SBS5 TaxID=3401754 RepID=UPI003AABFF3B